MDMHITFQPSGKSLKIRSGTSILQAARTARIAIKTRCGGNAACLMCKVEVEKGSESSLTPPTAAEKHKLGASQLDQGIRLACQCKIIGDAEIRLPEDPLKAAIRKQLELGAQASDELW